MQYLVKSISNKGTTKSIREVKNQSTLIQSLQTIIVIEHECHVVVYLILSKN